MSQEASTKNTVNFARSLLDARPDALGANGEAGVEALSHKVDVVKKVARSYDGDWKKPADEALLGGQEMETLALMFVFAAATDGDGGPDAGGKRLKWLNSAYNVLDLAAAAGTDSSQLATIRGTVNSQLEQLLPA